MSTFYYLTLILFSFLKNCIHSFKISFSYWSTYLTPECPPELKSVLEMTELPQGTGQERFSVDAKNLEFSKVPPLPS